jgi:hypothetical protein
MYIIIEFLNYRIGDEHNVHSFYFTNSLIFRLNKKYEQLLYAKNPTAFTTNGHFI